jgi:prepilin-type N-terminal cleavage/methylation domain-containing protein
MRRAFTLIEVLAALLVVTIGMASVIGMVAYAVILANRSQAASTAMATALTVLDDSLPLKGLDWLHTTAPLTGGSGDSRGSLNGYYVVRHETASGGLADGLASSRVDVEVYDSLGGRLVASLSSRQVKRR